MDIEVRSKPCSSNSSCGGIDDLLPLLFRPDSGHCDVPYDNRTERYT